MSGRTISQAGRKKPLPWRVRARAWWLKLHRWAGLALLLLGVLLGLTGSVNVYHREIDRKLNPGFYEPLSQQPALPLQQLLDKARAHDDAPVVSLILPDSFWPTLLVHQRHSDGSIWRTSLDPASGQVLGTRNQGEALLPVIYRLHENLLLKKYWGGELVGIAGLLLAGSLVTGWLLWWPGWKRLTQVVRKRRIVDLHGSVGAVFTPVLLIVSLSGVAMAFNGAARFLVSRVAATEVVDPLKVQPLADVQPMGPDEVLALARAERPHDVALVLLHPNDKNAFWRVAMHPEGMHPTVGGLTQVFVDPYRRQVVRVRTLNRLPPGEQFLMLQFPAHNGALAGNLGRLLVFLSGLTLSGLCLSGLWIWGRKQLLQRRAELKKRTRAVAQAAPEAVALYA